MFRIANVILESNVKVKKPDCMDRNAKSSYIFDAEYSYLTQYLPEVCRWQESFCIPGMFLSQRSRSKYLNSGCMDCNANIP